MANNTKTKVNFNGVKDRPNILYYKEWAEMAIEMPDDMQLALFKSLNNYIVNKEMPTRDNPCYWVFSMWAKQLDRDEEKYIATCVKNKGTAIF